MSGLVLVASFVTGIAMGVLVLVAYLRTDDRPKRVRVAGLDLAVSDYRGAGGVRWRL